MRVFFTAKFSSLISYCGAFDHRTHVMSVIKLYLTRLLTYLRVSFKADVCQNYQTLSDAERKETYSSEYPHQSDSSLNGWYRFQGAAGTRMATSCPFRKTCDANFPGWLSNGHPTVADAIVRKQVCFRKSGSCCGASVFIDVKNCSYYYIYKFAARPTGAGFRFCGAN